MKHILKTQWRSKALQGAFILLCASVAAFANEDVYTGPGRLSELVRESDFIVVASCVKTQAVEASLYTLDFAVRNAVKGDLKTFTLQISERNSPVFYTMTAPHPALVFLKNGAGGKPELTTFASAVQLDAGDTGLPAVLSREMEIRSMPAGSKRNTALQRFILPLLATGGNSYTGESLAEDLLDLCHEHGNRLTAPELALVSRVATNTDYYKVALPLALVLAEQDAPQADAACLHALVDTDVLTKDHSFRLAPVLAKRPNLRESYIRKIEQAQDSTQAGHMLTQLYLVDQATMDPIYERLWHNNAATRKEIGFSLKQSGTPGHDQLLRRLTTETGPP
jgi:hypothetical protein